MQNIFSFNNWWLQWIFRENFDQILKRWKMTQKKKKWKYLVYIPKLNPTFHLNLLYIHYFLSQGILEKFDVEYFFLQQLVPTLNISEKFRPNSKQMQISQNNDDMTNLKPIFCPYLRILPCSSLKETYSKILCRKHFPLASGAYNEYFGKISTKLWKVGKWPKREISC